jgi:hypothetical protein
VPDVTQAPVNGLPAMKDSADIEQKRLPTPAEGVAYWLDLEAGFIYQRLAEKFEMELAAISARFGELRLDDGGNAHSCWQYHPQLGVYRDVE